MNVNIPPGLTELLQDFTIAVLTTRPDNLINFSADYFNNLRDRQSNGSSVVASSDIKIPVAESPPPEKKKKAVFVQEEPKEEEGRFKFQIFFI